MTKEELAIAVVNLREALAATNKMLTEDGKFGIHCDEKGSPTFRRGRHFWAEVRKLTSPDPDE